MSTAADRKVFLGSGEATLIREELLGMVESADYNTGSAGEFTTEFIEKHLNYISKFSYIDPHQYIMNLKMKSRI